MDFCQVNTKMCLKLLFHHIVGRYLRQKIFVTMSKWRLYEFFRERMVTVRCFCQDWAWSRWTSSGTVWWRMPNATTTLCTGSSIRSAARTSMLWAWRPTSTSFWRRYFHLLAEIQSPKRKPAPLMSLLDSLQGVGAFLVGKRPNNLFMPCWLVSKQIQIRYYSLH